MTEEEKIKIVIKEGLIPEYMIPEDDEIPWDIFMTYSYEGLFEIDCVDVYSEEAAQSYYDEYMQKLSS